MIEKGSLVQLIDDSNFTHFSKFKINLPVKGIVYTVRGFHPFVPSLYLHEIDNSYFIMSTSGRAEPAFQIKRFRELTGAYDETQKG